MTEFHVNRSAEIKMAVQETAAEAMNPATVFCNICLTAPAALGCLSCRAMLCGHCDATIHQMPLLAGHTRVPCLASSATQVQPAEALGLGLNLLGSSMCELDDNPLLASLAQP